MTTSVSVNNSLLNKVLSQHSTYWLGNQLVEMMQTCEPGSPEYYRRLISIQRGVSNFVQVVTGKQIPVIFSSGNESWTQGTYIVLSAKVDPTQIDVVVGTALHEGAHCLLSNESFRFLRMCQEFKAKNTPDYFDEILRCGSILEDAEKAKLDYDSVKRLVHLMMNYLEDRRIDLWMYQNAKGYRPYYQALYDAYWHHPTIDIALRDPKFRYPSLKNYELFVLNMTNKHFDPSALPELDKIRDIVNFTVKGLFARGDNDPNWHRWLNMTGQINYENLPLLVRDAVHMAEIIVRNIKPESSPDIGNSADNNLENMNDGSNNTNPLDFLPNMDLNTFPDSQSSDTEIEFKPVSSEDVEEALNKQRDFLQHKIFEKEKVPSSFIEKLNHMMASNIKFKSVEGDMLPKGVKCPVTIYSEVTATTVKDTKFPMGSGGTQNPDAVKAISDGIRMGQILSNRINVIQNETFVKYTRQSNGRIDPRLMASLGFGDAEIFYHKVLEQHTPADIWLDVDLSGSMHGLPFRNSMALAIAIAYAANVNRKMNCTISVRTGDQNGSACIAIIYDSKKHTFQRIRDVVPYLYPQGSTPEGLCFDALKEEILRNNKATRKYFVNISDGEPAFTIEHNGRGYMYSGTSAFKHTKKIMDEFRNNNIRVLSYLIDDHSDTLDDHPGFKEMYGNDARLVEVSNIPGIARTLNGLLVQRD